MQPAPGTAEMWLEAALHAVAEGPLALTDALDSLPAAIYVTDRDGIVTHHNRACIDFAGRVPEPLRDKWCVTWKLFETSGEFLPHDRCPMAVAIREKRPVRGAEAVAQRPDGSRVNFVPYPTPFFDAAGELAGAVNLLLDVTNMRRLAELREKAVRCRRLARSIGDEATAETLTDMADEYEAEAGRLG
jgi:PAS domain S-box-containing protein